MVKCRQIYSNEMQFILSFGDSSMFLDLGAPPQLLFLNKCDCGLLGRRVDMYRE